ncbi:thioredoxin-like protein CITRX1, chloroplastic isoform X2 [Phalaenopsis equestris]|uniref:thioredoxin-like protein CITRX1, chloroplastic isoform X2 n=1 Tax=Phalaenopsis equestris TaxID=78828 RepID=UPI0009E1E5B1|nr:thioredoxin-like protein CITRX1, chloroplastic isoform X2 [Phalaenopsis equestris]
MATVIPISPSSVAYRCRPSSPAAPLLLSPRFANTSFTVPLSLFPSLSTRNRRACPVFAAAKKKYIEDDYLVKKVSAKELEELVKGERSVPIVLDFYATWCGPCILMAQDLEMLVDIGAESLYYSSLEREYQYGKWKQAFETICQCVTLARI